MEYTNQIVVDVRQCIMDTSVHTIMTIFGYE